MSVLSPVPTRDDFRPLDTCGLFLSIYTFLRFFFFFLVFLSEYLFKEGFLLHVSEQLELVSSFESQHARQSRVWKGVFSGFLLIYAVFLAYCIFQQLRHPWELRYHAYFMDDLDSWIVISADCAAVLACLLAVMGLLRDPVSHPQWLLYSCYMGACLALFWLYYMMRLPRFPWDIIWLPLGPFSGALLCLYMNHLLAESLEDIRKLRGSMYYHKTR